MLGVKDRLTEHIILVARMYKIFHISEAFDGIILEVCPQSAHRLVQPMDKVKEDVLKCVGSKLVGTGQSH